jgi:steroid delta-isomerase-like uncharacterized protein
MSVKKNKKTARRYLEKIWNEGKLKIEDEIFSADYVYHDPAAPEIRGIEAHKQFVMTYRTAFPDLHFTIEDMIAKGNKVVTRWTSTGTHQGELMGIPATGKATTGMGTNILRFEDDKIVEEWSNWHTLGLLQQLGVIPPMGGE